MGVCLTVMIGNTRQGNSGNIIFNPEIIFETDKMLSDIYEDLWDKFQPFIADFVSIYMKEEMDSNDGYGDKLKYYKLDHFLEWIDSNLPKLTTKREVYYGHDNIKMESVFEEQRFQALYQMLKALKGSYMKYVLCWYS